MRMAPFHFSCDFFYDRIKLKKYDIVISNSEFDETFSIDLILWTAGETRSTQQMH